jgi:hypothetical protein
MREKNTFSSIVERSLFSPSRRPHREQMPTASAPSPDFSLFGVVITAGEAVALVKAGACSDPMRVKQGEEVSGWTVARVEPDRILVRRDVIEQELLLDFASPASPPPEAAAPVGTQPTSQAGVKSPWQPNEDDEQTSQTTPPSETDPAIDQPSASKLIGGGQLDCQNLMHGST